MEEILLFSHPIRILDEWRVQMLLFALGVLTGVGLVWIAGEIALRYVERVKPA